MEDPIVDSTPPTLIRGKRGKLYTDTTGALRVVLPTAGGGGAVTIADGADVAEGSTTDAAATQGGTGTISAKLRTVTAQLNTLAGYLDGVETLLTAGNASTASIDTKASSLATSAKQDTQITAEQAILAKLPIIGTSRVPTCTAAVASASTTAGVQSATFVASSDFSGTVLGQAFAAGASLSFRAPRGDTIGAMAFTRSAGTLFIYYIP